VERLEAADCPAGPVLDREDWLDHPQVRALGLRVELDDPQRGVVVMPGVPLGMSVTPGRVRAPAPARPEEGSAGDVWPPRRLPRRDQHAAEGPLSGYRVLDLGAFLAGPYAGSLLAELGAEVIKVEPPAGESFPRDMGFHYNRGQRSLAIDLQAPAGLEAFERLVSVSDVVLDNFRPGVLERLSIDHESLSRVSSGIVSASLTGFGDTGPLRDKPGFDPLLMAMSGMMAAQGGDAEPVFLTHAANDVTAAVSAALGICLALFHRERSGVGQRVSSSLAAVSLFMQSGELVRYPGRPAPRRGGRDHPGEGPLDRFYAVADGWIRVQAAGIEDLLGAGLPAEASARDLVSRIESWLGPMTGREAVDRLMTAGVPAVVARRQSDMAGDRALVEAGYLQALSRADGGAYYVPGRLALFSRTQRRGTLVAPGVGEHSRQVLREAGLEPAAIDSLVAEGVVAAGEPYTIRLRPNYR
jgi:crotonobetainyl-CoA:carnitine CoA-transferase CaiB-like acyl-CoA transferase